MKKIICVFTLLIYCLSAYNQDELNLFVGTSISSQQSDVIFSKTLIAPTIGFNLLWQIKNKLHFVANVRYQNFGYSKELSHVTIKSLNWNYGLSIKAKKINYGFVISYTDPLAFTASEIEIDKTYKGVNLMAITDYKLKDNLKIHLAYTHGLTNIISDTKFKVITIGYSYNLITPK